MTNLPPVREDDKRLTTLERLRLYVHDHETFDFTPDDAEELLEEFEAIDRALTGQHSRAAEAVSDQRDLDITILLANIDSLMEVAGDLDPEDKAVIEQIRASSDARFIGRASPASPSATGVRVKATKLHFTNDWLRDKIESDPDLDTEAGGPPILSATVRPLEWRQDHIVGDWFALCIVGTYLISYCVDDDRGEWLEVLRPDGTEIGVFGTDRTDEAKAYAQADYDRVVLSALVEQP